MHDPEVEAFRTIGLLKCPCGALSDPACRPDRDVRGCVFRCGSCGAMTFASGEDASIRDGAFAWNAWVRKVREKQRTVRDE